MFPIRNLAVVLVFAAGCVKDGDAAVSQAALEPAPPAGLSGCTYAPSPACSPFTNRSDVWQYSCEVTRDGKPYDGTNGYDAAHPYPFNPLNVTDQKCHFVAWYSDRAEQALYCCAPDEQPLSRPSK